VAPQPQPQPPTPVLPVTAVPEGYVYGAHHQLCPLLATQQSTKCTSTADIAYNIAADSLFCDQYAECCMCSSIQCGKHGVPCNEISFGEFGAYGVRDIKVSGNPSPAEPGATIYCQGVESCRGTQIIADHVSALDCQGDKSCEGATVLITDPKPGFVLNCAGLGACSMLQIVIDFSAPPAGYMCRAVDVKDMFAIEGILCSNSAACEGLEITINNEGCDKVLMDTVQCNQYHSCTAAIFNFVGDIDIAFCECGPSCANTQGLDKCFENLEFLSCPDALSCMGVSKTIMNPMDSFELKCGDVKSCADARFDIVLNAGTAEPVRFIKGLFLSGESSGQGATFTVENKQGFDVNTGLAIELEMERIECAGLYSCVDTTFIIGNGVRIGETICAAGACNNCVIKRNIADVGVACNPAEIAPVGSYSFTTTSTTTTTTRLPKIVPIGPFTPAV
jgi:hypothetical protein